MPIITERRSFNGFDSKVLRLGLGMLVEEVEGTITGFRLDVQEERHANGTRGIRQMFDEQFAALGKWKKIVSGGVDWTKAIGGNTLGVEIQVSGRSDLLAVDVLHLRRDMIEGSLDAGIIVVPDDALSRYLTDRTPNLKTAIRHVEPDMALQIIAFKHDGVGPALPKARTNLGR